MKNCHIIMLQFGNGIVRTISGNYVLRKYTQKIANNERKKKLAKRREKRGRI
jgi:hypothetical protein